MTLLAALALVGFHSCRPGPNDRAGHRH
jgi:hypothetical protein